jgi:hypothetical protein
MAFNQVVPALGNGGKEDIGAMSLEVFLECYNSLHHPSCKPKPLVLMEFTITLNPALVV